jgi:hypothetical protein
MSLSERIACDICGVQKQESNHWIMWFQSDGTDIGFAAWVLEEYRNLGHLCGETCAGKMLAKSITEWREKGGE